MSFPVYKDIEIDIEVDVDDVVDAINGGYLDINEIHKKIKHRGDFFLNEDIYSHINKMSYSQMYTFIFNMPESIKQKLLTALQEK